MAKFPTSDTPQAWEDAVGVGQDRTFTAGIIVGMFIGGALGFTVGVVFAVTRRFRVDLRENRRLTPILRRGFWVGVWNLTKWGTISAVVLVVAVLAFVQGPDRSQVTPATSPSPVRPTKR